MATDFMVDYGWIRRMALTQEGGRDDLATLSRAYLLALEALEWEVAGRKHNLTAKLLGPRMPDRAP